MHWVTKIKGSKNLSLLQKLNFFTALNKYVILLWFLFINVVCGMYIVYRM